jgi:hypothetical protein
LIRTGITSAWSVGRGAAPRIIRSTPLLCYVGSGEEIEAPAHTKFLGRHRGPALDCDRDAKMDDVAYMAVAALEHPEASVMATGEAGSKPRRRQPSGKSCELIRQMRISLDELP